MSEPVSMRSVSSVREVDAAVWDALANPALGEETEAFDRNPFLSHAFFDALEVSGSASARTGWMPHHLVMERGGETIGVLPCYVKSHSQGEYVFDYGWADAFERAGGNYYPKLQCTVPFTPATGRRLLVGNGEDRMERQALLGEGLRQVCEELGVSSAHITFQREDEAKLLEAMGYLERNDQQFHWRNRGHNRAGDPYPDFDAFLASLNSRKRKDIRKERAQAVANVEIEWLTGAQLTEEVWDTFFRFYMDTGSRKYGRPYLTRDFYTRIGTTMADDIVLVMAKRGGRHVAGAINFVGSHTLFGRHWGCVEHHPMLHFECCYYQAIDYAIAHGLSAVEAGAQGGHKLARGYMPTLTYSTHHITHPGLRQAVSAYLEQEREAVAYEAEAIGRHGPFRKGDG